MSAALVAIKSSFCALRLASRRRSAFVTAPGPRGAVRTMASGAPAYSVLQYKYVTDILEKRGPYREGHLGAARKMQEGDKLLMAGAFGDPVEGGLFIFKNSTKEEIERYVQEDPYVQNGLVVSWTIKPYLVAVGP